jgi:hypothetical protein
MAKSVAPNVGRANKEKLLADGRLKYDPVKGLDQLPNPSEKKQKKNRETGEIETVEVSRGPVKDPDNPIWRVGYSAEKHALNVRKEIAARNSGKNEKIAPDLLPEELEDFTAKFPEEAEYVTGNAVKTKDLLGAAPKKPRDFDESRNNPELKDREYRKGVEPVDEELVEEAKEEIEEEIEEEAKEEAEEKPKKKPKKK